jgi:hypothetical protein
VVGCCVQGNGPLGSPHLHGDSSVPVIPLCEGKEGVIILLRTRFRSKGASPTFHSNHPLSTVTHCRGVAPAADCNNEARLQVSVLQNSLT